MIAIKGTIQEDQRQMANIIGQAIDYTSLSSITQTCYHVIDKTSSTSKIRYSVLEKERESRD
jgi:hypothetical protein